MSQVSILLKGWSYTWKCLVLCSGPQRKFIAKAGVQPSYPGMQLGVKQTTESHFNSYIPDSISYIRLWKTEKCLLGSDETMRKEGDSPWAWLAIASIISWKTEHFLSWITLLRIQSSPGLFNYSINKTGVVSSHFLSRYNWIKSNTYETQSHMCLTEITINFAK